MSRAFVKDADDGFEDFSRLARNPGTNSLWLPALDTAAVWASALQSATASRAIVDTSEVKSSIVTA
jgi:hypothetical protein